MIGTHQSFTYAKPLKWYYKPFHFIAKCQNKTIEEQYELGVRLFDIRIKPYKNNWVVAHGNMIFNINLYKVLNYLNDKKDCIVHLSLEYNKEPKNSEEIIKKFKQTIISIIELYPNIKFYGFRTKWNWNNKVYSYQDEPNIQVLQLVSSTTGTILDDWIPILFTKVFKKDIKRIYNYLKPEVYLSIDFI